MFHPQCRRVQHGHAVYPLGQHFGPGQRAHGVQCGQRLRRGLPEGMLRGQHQKRKRLHAPVGGAGGVVVFRHHQIRVGVADRQHAAVIGDRLHRPPVEMPRDNTLDNARREHRQLRRRAQREKRCLRKAVGLAAAIGDRRAVFIKPVDKILRKLAGAGAEFFAPRRVIVLHRHGVEQRVKYDGKAVIVVFHAALAVKVPAVGVIIAVDAGQPQFKPLFIIRHTALFQCAVDQNAKELPVAVAALIVVDVVEPLRQIFAFGVGQRIPQHIGGKQQTVGDCRHLDKFLVKVAAAAPIPRSAGGRAGHKTAAVDFFPRGIMTAARPERHQRPQRAAECLHRDGRGLVMGGGCAQGKAAAAQRQAAFQRFQQGQHPGGPLCALVIHCFAP